MLNKKIDWLWWKVKIENLFLTCLNFVRNSLENSHSFSMFFFAAASVDEILNYSMTLVSKTIDWAILHDYSFQCSFCDFCLKLWIIFFLTTREISFFCWIWSHFWLIGGYSFESHFYGCTNAKTVDRKTEHERSPCPSFGSEMIFKLDALSSF